MLAVIRKDLAEQSFVLAPACMLALVGLVALASRGPVHPDALLRAFHTFVVALAAPLAVVGVRQLVVNEFVRRGFHALEPLPVSIPRVLLGKAVTSFMLAGGVVVAGAAVTTSALRLLTDLPPDAAQALVTRAAAFVLAVHGAAFLLACTGRHRHAVLFAAIAVLGAAQRAGLDLERLGPWRLARDGFFGPGDALDPAAMEAGLIGLAGIALGTALASVRRSRLARAWSGRWRAADAGRALALAVVAAAIVGGERLAARPALRLEGATIERGVVSVRVPSPEHEERAALVADLAARVMDDWARRTGADAPPLGVELAAGLPPDATRRLEAAGAHGLLVATAFTAPAWDPAAFRAALLGELVADAGGSANDLALDGLPLWLAQREATAAADALRARVELHAAWAIETLGGLPPLADWPRVTDRVGPRAARALAAWVLDRLAAHHGPDAVDRLLDAALRARPIERAFGGGPLARLAAATGADAGDLDAALAREAAALTAARAGDLAALPRPAHVQVEAEPDGALRFEVSPGPGCPADTLCALVHAPATDRAPWRPRRDEALVGGPAGRTLARYAAGRAVRCGVAVPAPVDGGELVVGWRRVVVGAAAGAGP